MEVTRRGFLGAASFGLADLVLNNGSISDLLVKNAEATPYKGIESLTQDDFIYDINRALQKVKLGRNRSGYEDAFAHFTSTYDKSLVKYNQTQDAFFLKTAVVSAMYAGRTMLDTSSLNHGKKKESLDRALSSYGNAINARQMLGTDKSPLYKRNLIDLPVADEKLIRKRISEVYEELVRITRGWEKENYLRSLIKTYERLIQLTDGTERFNYQARIQDISPQLGKR